MNGVNLRHLGVRHGNDLWGYFALVSGLHSKESQLNKKLSTDLKMCRVLGQQLAYNI